jgi:uncharacterized protein YxeA
MEKLIIILELVFLIIFSCYIVYNITRRFEHREENPLFDKRYTYRLDRQGFSKQERSKFTLSQVNKTETIIITTHYCNEIWHYCLKNNISQFSIKCNENIALLTW